MPMQLDWVEAIFGRLALAYGGRFMAQYEGLQPEHVKTAWSTELDGITSRGIAHALKNLPGDFPVNAMQFRKLCREAHTPDARPALPAPAGQVTPADVERLARAVAPMRNQRDPKAWAHALKAREDAGERLSRMQRDAWRAALCSSARNMEASIGAGYSAIPDAGTVKGTAYDPA